MRNATFRATMVTTRAAALICWVLLAAGGGLVLGACIVSSNIPGLSDGLEPYSWPLAGWTAAAALYIGAVGVLSLARLRRG